MLDDSAFLKELEQIVVRRAASMHLVDTMAFVAEVAERLEEDPVFGEYVPVEYSGQGTKNKQIRIHGFTQLDESDGTIGLIIGKWKDEDELETLTTSTVKQLSSWLENFVFEAVEGGLEERIAEANSAYELASTLRDYRSKIARIRLHIFSNQPLSQKFKEEMCGSIAGIPIERQVWDLLRLKAIYESSREREAVEIQLSDFGSGGIPYLEASRSEQLTSYLCVVEGALLADLFERYGSRLLEGNVRSFLGMKGGVNKGIRSTIQDVPSLFFAYNNGIAATAQSVTVSEAEGATLITGLVDFQIVNGGQTTASILNARKKDRLSLTGVTVQMKLTEINPTDAHDLIPKIAQYANTQNKVAVADFFANHPFHRKMEETSRRLQVPAKANTRVRSKWFYERSRGQFQNERLYLSKSKKDAFDLEYPGVQVINKTELAKYDSTWRERPHWVSLGAQKNFTRFASQFTSSNSDVSESEYWLAISPNFGDSYYQHIVAIAILWKQTESIISGARGTWYEGDYRPQIASYSLALLFNYCRSTGRELDLVQIWLQQGIDITLEKCIGELAISVQKAILSPPAGMTNVGEWTKKEACWDKVKQIAIPKLSGLDRWAASQESFKKIRSEGRKQGAQDDGIALQKEILELVRSGFWQAMLRWPKVSDLLPLTDRNLVSRASTLQGFVRINTEKDWRRLLEIKKICEEEGFRNS